MKLIEKKCPNCGASLSFDENDKVTKCDYCKREFEIERDAQDQISLVIGETGKSVIKYFFISHMVIGIISIIVFLIIFGFIIFGIYTGNYLIPIYKGIYSNGETTYTIFTPVVYENVKFDYWGNITSSLGTASIDCPTVYFNLEHSEYSVGYEDLNALYDDVIKQYESDYEISEK